MCGLKPVPFTQNKVIGQALRARNQKPETHAAFLPNLPPAAGIKRWQRTYFVLIKEPSQ